MFNLFKKPKTVHSQLSILNLKLSGLHCSSCAVNIDLSLEELPGVINSKTNYARSSSIVDFDPQRIDRDIIITEINKLGYNAEVIN